MSDPIREYHHVYIKQEIETVSHSFIAHTYGRAERPVCHFIAGFFAGFISAAWGAEVTCTETSCSSVTGDVCVFEWEAA